MHTLSKPRNIARSLIALLLILAPAAGALAQSRSHARPHARPHAQATRSQTHAGQSQVRNVAVLPIEGPNAGKLRTGLSKSLLHVKTKVKVVPSDRVDAAAEQAGVDLSSPHGKVVVAQQLQIAAFVDGELKKSKQNAEVELRVYDGRTGEVVGKTVVKGRANAIERLATTHFWGKLGRAILTKTKAPAKQAEAAPAEVARAKTRAAEPEEEVEEDTEAAAPKKNARAAPAEEEDLGDEEESPRGKREEAVAENEPEREEGPAPTALEVGARLRVMTRSYTYNEPLGQIAQHDLQPTPALRLEARWYPGAHFTTGVLANLGLDMFYQLMYPVKATAAIGEFPTSSSALGVAARLRVPLASHEFGILAGYSNLSFDFEDAKNAVAQVPSVSYGSFKIGGDARFAVTSSVSLGFYAAYLMVQGFGELASTTWFPHTSGNGLELELRGGYSLSKTIEATAAFGVTRYGLSLNPKPTDPSAMLVPARVAGGVTDQYFNGGLGLTWRP